MRVLYFAYGSNMSEEQLWQRISTVKFYGIGYIKDTRMICNKRSKDGSGKANILRSPGDVTWGVLYEIDESMLKRLDEFERGYNRQLVEIYTEKDLHVTAETYTSNTLTEHPVSYDWYKELILHGADEHKLPQSYREYLARLPSRPDPVRNRTEKKQITA